MLLVSLRILQHTLHNFETAHVHSANFYIDPTLTLTRTLTLT